MKKVFIFMSNYTDGRTNFNDAVVASNFGEAEEKATLIVRSIDEEGYGCDENATVEIIAKLATDPKSLAEEFKN